MKYFNQDNFDKRYDRLGRAYFKSLDSKRKEKILAARKELKRIWQIRYLKGTN